MSKKSRKERPPANRAKRKSAGSVKKGAASAGKGASRKPKKTSAPRDADGIQELADELRAVAATIDSYADAMRKMRIESIRPLTGNWDLAVAKLRDVINKQILARLLVEATNRGHEAHELFRQ